MLTLDPYLPWLVWGIPFVGAALTPLLTKVGHRVRDYGAVAFSFASASVAALMLPRAFRGEVVDLQADWIPSLSIKAGVLVDPLSVIMANVVAWISFLIMLYSIGYMHGEPGLTRYWFLMLFFIGNMLLLVMSDNLLQLLIGWEGVGICSYALIGFWYGDEEERWVGEPGHRALGVDMAYPPSHAGMKAFIFTRVGDVALLVAVFAIYAYSGTFNFLELSEDMGWARELARAGLLVPLAILFFVGPIGKSAQLPLHEWLPDAMAGPTSVSALIHAATMVKAGVFLVARGGPIFFKALHEFSELLTFFQVIAWVGALTAFVAATQALVSREVKKVMAYSTISQIGYMMLALGVGGLLAEFAIGLTAGLFHLMSHAIFKAALFLAAGAMIHSCHTRFMDEMGGVWKDMKITFVSMTIAALSLTGLPPLMGFWSKEAVLKATVEAGQMHLFVIGVATAVLTGLYSVRMLGMSFFGEKSSHLHDLEKKGFHVHEAPAVMWVPYSLLAGATIALGIGGFLGFEKGLEALLTSGGASPLAKAHGSSPDAAFIALIGSLAALALGVGIGSVFYLLRAVDAGAVVSRSPILTAIRGFFRNRWYINPVYYRAFRDGTYSLARWLWRSVEVLAFDRLNLAAPSGTLRLSGGLFKSLETAVIDRFNYKFSDAMVRFSSFSDRFDLGVVDGFINAVASGGRSASTVLRRIQTGVVQQYVVVFVSGLSFIILILIFLMAG